MEDTSVFIAGELSVWPSKELMAAILQSDGLNVQVGKDSVRVEDCSNFSFDNYGGDICEPSIEADADSLEQMLQDGKRVSDALAKAEVRHRFELYNFHKQMVGYLHFDWPLGHNR